MNKSQRRMLEQVQAWFQSQQRQPFAYQLQSWKQYLEGKHGLIHAPTGMGKTNAAFLGAVIEWKALAEPVSTDRPVAAKRRQAIRYGLQVLWITPLRALSRDTAVSLQSALDALQVPWVVETRTGDTSSAVRQRQRQRLPEVLITTPESLSLMLSHEDTRERLASLRLVVADEWHELMGTKRGVQTELALARIRNWLPSVRVWGLSATIGNVEEAVETLLGKGARANMAFVRAKTRKTLQMVTMIPETIERFPWAGHLGTRLAPAVAARVQACSQTIVFTNTRSQTESWYRALLSAAPDLAGQLAIHHGSIDPEQRRWVEEGLRSGKLRCCVATSSLDLGVDFPTVEQVIQVGSPKGVARLLQRGGRSGHQPDASSQVILVPTNALELLEFAALRDAVKHQQIESRPALRSPLDVLVQHLVTVAIGGGFVAEELRAEVASTHAYASLTDEEWQWALQFVVHGGLSLAAYDDFHKVVIDGGVHRVVNQRIARLHRMSIGTIVSDHSIAVKYLRGTTLGTVEESFISRLDPGSKFLFGGKLLELIRVHDNTAWVRRATGTSTTIPRWMGGRMPLSSELSNQLRRKIGEAAENVFSSNETKAMKPLLLLQQAWSALPGEDDLLIERLQNRQGHHLFFYPFEGRQVHEGLAALFAMRMSRIRPITFSMAMNDYGFVLASREPAPLEEACENGLFECQGLNEDILHGLNATEMTRRQFREIARIAGLVFQGYPGQPKSNRQVQASSNLFHDVFVQYDPANKLLLQARREVLRVQLEEDRLHEALLRMQQSHRLLRELRRPGPLAFGLLVDQLRDRVSSETLADRVRRMVEELEREANQTAIVRPH